MTDAMKIRLIDAYANLIEKYGQNNKAIDNYYDKLGVQKVITHLSNEIINISFNKGNKQ